MISDLFLILIIRITIFIRSTNEYKFVSICNEKFEILQSVTTEEFTAWLQEKYDCQLGIVNI